MDMQLLLLVGDDVLDHIPVNRAKLQEPDYLIFLQQELLLHHEEELEHYNEKAHFALENIPSKMAYQSLLDQHTKEENP